MPVERYEPYASLLVALGVGLLIGLERERSAPRELDPQRSLSAGVRTIPLLALVGALTAMLARAYGGWLIAVGLAAIALLLWVPYALDVREGRDRGLTSEAAAMAAFLLGGLTQAEEVLPALGQRLIVASALGVVVTLLLSTKAQLHRAAHHISREDVFSTLKFLVLVVIVLPLLPNRTFGPMDVLNPFEAGLLVVLIATVSFAGYISVRLLGPGRGLGVTGLVGGLVSSTAVTLACAGHAKREPQLLRANAMAVLLASSMMFPRMLFEVGIVNADLLPTVGLPLGLMTLAGFGAAGIFYLRLRRARAAKEGAPQVKHHNPFEIGSAVKFALLFILVLFGAKASEVYFGHGGLYLAALFAGFTDVDAITLSIAKLAEDGLSARSATLGIVIAACSNTATKAVIAAVVGGWAFGRAVLLGFALPLAAAIIGTVYGA
jgi:uncharacterized membrane protein (DUF4010 family)